VILLDPTTILLTSTLMAGAMSIVLFSAYRSFPPEVKGLGQWALGMCSLTLAGIILCSQGVIPEALTLFAANTTMMGCAGLMLIGTQRFYGRPAGGGWPWPGSPAWAA
jgi:hypothetical protein